MLAALQYMNAFDRYDSKPIDPVFLALIMMIIRRKNTISVCRISSSQSPAKKKLHKGGTNFASKYDEHSKVLTR